MTENHLPVSVLVVSEDDACRQHITTMLTSDSDCPYTIQNAETLQAARQLLLISQADVILLDLAIPDSKGMRAFHCLKDLAENAAILVLTDSCNLDLEGWANQAGIHEVLYKDALVGGELIRAIRYGLDRASMAQRLIKATGDIEILYAQLQIRNAELLKLDEIKSHFISAFSHELRTPITSAGESIRLIADEECGPVTLEQKQLLDIAIRNLSRLESMVNRLVIFSLIETERLTLQKVWQPLFPLLESVISENQGAADLQRTTLRYTRSETPVSCWFDYPKMVLVLSNLIENAIRHTPNGIIIIREFIDPEHQVSGFEVSDNGEGIPDENISHIFDKFYSVTHDQYREPGTLGIGLAFCQEIVKMHSGTISLTTKVGEGSVFQVKLPLSPDIES